MIAPTYLPCSNYPLKIETALWKYCFQSFKININFILRASFSCRTCLLWRTSILFFSVWKVFKITLGIVFHTIADSLKQNINFWLSEGISFLRVSYFQPLWIRIALPGLSSLFVAPQWRSQPSNSRAGEEEHTRSITAFPCFLWHLPACRDPKTHFLKRFYF